MSINSDDSLSDLLGGCGFDAFSARILMQLLIQGPSSAGTLAKRSKMKRPTVYAVLGQLIDGGLVERSRRRKVQRFSLFSRQGFLDSILTRARTHFDGIENSVKLLGQKLADFPEERQFELAGLEVSVFEERDDVFREVEAALTSGDCCGLFNPQTACSSSEGKQVTRRYLSKTAEKRSRIREILVNGGQAEWYRRLIRNPNHLVKELPASSGFNADLIFTNGYLILNHYEDGNMLAIKIRHSGLYSSILALFNVIWEKL